MVKILSQFKKYLRLAVAKQTCEPSKLNILIRNILCPIVDWFLPLCSRP